MLRIMASPTRRKAQKLIGLNKGNHTVEGEVHVSKDVSDRAIVDEVMTLIQCLGHFQEHEENPDADFVLALLDEQQKTIALVKLIYQSVLPGQYELSWRLAQVLIVLRNHFCE